MRCSGCKRALCAEKFPDAICPLCSGACVRCMGSGSVPTWRSHSADCDLDTCTACDGTGEAS